MPRLYGAATLVAAKQGQATQAMAKQREEGDCDKHHTRYKPENRTSISHRRHETSWHYGMRTTIHILGEPWEVAARVVHVVVARGGALAAASTVVVDKAVGMGAVVAAEASGTGEAVGKGKMVDMVVTMGEALATTEAAVVAGVDMVASWEEVKAFEEVDWKALGERTVGDGRGKEVRMVGIMGSVVVKPDMEDWLGAVKAELVGSLVVGAEEDMMVMVVASSAEPMAAAAQAVARVEDEQEEKGVAEGQRRWEQSR